MSRKQQTTATFQVRIVLPKGSNCQQAQHYIRDAMQSYGKGSPPDDPFFDIQPDWFIVALVKKETYYGK